MLLIKTSPEEGVSRPASKLSSVDFPHPDGPKIAIDSAGLTSSLKLFNIEFWLSPSAYEKQRERHLMILFMSEHLRDIYFSGTPSWINCGKNC